MKIIPLADMARGGMGSVQLARVEGGRYDGQHFAIKRLHDNIARDPQFVAMFLDEAWMTAALHSPNVVEVAAWGRDDAGMYLAVELVQGVSLMRLIKEARQNGSVFPERTTAFIGSEICAGLAAAHALRGPDGALLGLVHRDLTPSNILVSFEGEIKIADFGIAKAEERITETKAGELKGKPGYMAPEQARGGKVDGRADLFSFGVLMFELLAGRKPWSAKSHFDMLLESATQPPADLASLRPGLSPLFVEIVNTCLEKDPERRYGSAAEIQALLDEWRRSNGFGDDDRALLGAFTRQNCAKQIEWFERAMRGDVSRTGEKTFQELQEEIDEARARAKKKMAAAVRPAAGRSAPQEVSTEPPSPASEQPASEQPASEQPASEQPASEQPAAGQPSTGRAPMISEPGEEDPTSIYRPDPAILASSQQGASLAPVSTRTGTELMMEAVAADLPPPTSQPQNRRPPGFAQHEVTTTSNKQAHAPPPPTVRSPRVAAAIAAAQVPQRSRPRALPLLLIAVPIIAALTVWLLYSRSHPIGGPGRPSGSEQHERPSAPTAGATGAGTQAAPPARENSPSIPGAATNVPAPPASITVDAGSDASPAGN